MVALTGEELLEWVDDTARNWKKLIEAHPEILALPCGIRETQTVAQALQHIVAAELRYTERLNDLPQTGYESIPYDSVEAIYATHERAMALLKPLLERGPEFWETPVEFATRSAGTLRATRRTFFVQLLTHAVRHYAQLGTLVREHGIKPGFEMDYLMMGLM
ncbi:MAG: DinB family protein [Acidobacteriota bacterium]